MFLIFVRVSFLLCYFIVAPVLFFMLFSFFSQLRPFCALFLFAFDRSASSLKTRSTTRRRRKSSTAASSPSPSRGQAWMKRFPKQKQKKFLKKTRKRLTRDNFWNGLKRHLSCEIEENFVGTHLYFVEALYGVCLYTCVSPSAAGLFFLAWPFSAINRYGEKILPYFRDNCPKKLGCSCNGLRATRYRAMLPLTSPLPLHPIAAVRNASRWSHAL